MSEIKNSIDTFNSRLYRPEERLGQREGRSKEIIWKEVEKDRREENRKKSRRHMWFTPHLIGILKGEGKEIGKSYLKT